MHKEPKGGLVGMKTVSIASLKIFEDRFDGKEKRNFCVPSVESWSFVASKSGSVKYSFNFC